MLLLLLLLVRWPAMQVGLLLPLFCCLLAAHRPRSRTHRATNSRRVRAR